MRILTTRAQIYRVAGLEGGPGQYPAYPYARAIPREIGKRLLACCTDLAWPADRDFLNDDGGFIVVYDRADEFDVRYFGLPSLDWMEHVERVECADGERWWHCCALANNETAIDYVFSEAVAPSDLLAALKARALEDAET